MAGNKAAARIVPAYVNTDNGLVWGSWTITGSTASITTDGIWTQWVTASGTSTATTISIISGAAWNNWNHVVQEPADQRRVREAAQVKAAAEAKVAAERRAVAKLRARKLLVDCLNEEQRETYDKKGFFYLYTQSGKKYRIDQGTHGNVKLVDETKNQLVGSYCIQPAGVPDEDAMLAQKLHLEMNEEEFLRVANFRAFNDGDYRRMAA